MSQEKLRRLYSHHRIPTTDDKSLQSALAAERLGFAFEGMSGWFGILNTRGLKILTLALELLRQVVVECLPIQVLMGQEGHALQARRALWSYAHHLYRFADPLRRGKGARAWPSKARRKLLGLMSLLPSTGTDFRAPIDECVTVSDACETGLGVSRTVGLTVRGTATSEAMLLDGDRGVLDFVRGPFACSLSVVLISRLDGIGGLCRSLQRLQVRVIMAVCVELGASLRRAVRAAFPGCIELGDVCEVSRRVIEQIILSAVGAGADFCLTGGGFPCQDVSRLHTGRAGIGGSRSSLFRELARVAKDSEDLSREQGLGFLGVAECVRMEAQDEVAVTETLGWSVIYQCPSGVLIGRRPRTFWVSSMPMETDDTIIEAVGRGHRMSFLGEVEPLEVWCTPG